MNILERRPLFNTFDCLHLKDIACLASTSKDMRGKTVAWVNNQLFVKGNNRTHAINKQDLNTICRFMQHHYELLDCNMTGTFSSKLQRTQIIFIGNEHGNRTHTTVTSLLVDLLFQQMPVRILAESFDQAEIKEAQSQIPENLMSCWDEDNLPEEFWPPITAPLLNRCSELIMFALGDSSRMTEFSVECSPIFFKIYNLFFPEVTHGEMQQLFLQFFVQADETSKTTQARFCHIMQKVTEKAITRLKARDALYHQHLTSTILPRNQAMVAHTIQQTKLHPLVLTMAGDGHLTHLVSKPEYVQAVKHIRLDCFKAGVTFMSLMPRDQAEPIDIESLQQPLTTVMQAWSPEPFQMPTTAASILQLEDATLNKPLTDFIVEVTEKFADLDSPATYEVMYVESLFLVALLAIDNKLKIDPTADFRGLLKDYLPENWQVSFASI
ncbi:MAG: hypothetical protein H0X51_00490 [Parachlamydiaceae bacterium]|nr:hypothetical protein [Parachlamydiaceae bacterium]